MKKAFLTLGLAALLAGCGGSEEDTLDPPAEAEIPELEEPAEPAPPAGESSQAPDQAATDQAEPNTIPARFHGAWVEGKSDCTPDAESWLKISAKRLEFYESTGAVAAVGAEGDDVLVTAKYSGEGQTWTDVTRLSLDGTGAGERLNLSDGSQPEQDNDFPRRRCPA